MVGLERPARPPEPGRPGSCLELLADERHGPLDLQPAHVGAGEDVARRPGRDRDLGEAEDAGGEIVADVALEAAGPGRGPDQAQSHGSPPVTTRPVSSNRACTDGEFQSRLAALRPRRGTPRPAAPGTAPAVASSRSKPTPPGPDQAAAEAAAAQERGQVQEVAAEPAAVRGGRQEADVAGQRAQVAGVVGQPLQFQGDAAQHLGADRDLAAGQGLDRLAVGRRVADRRVAGHASPS